VCFVDPLLFSLFFLVVPHSWLRASVYTMLFGTTLRVVWYVCVRVCVCACSADLNINTITFVLLIPW
jgi:hypothetical protein